MKNRIGVAQALADALLIWRSGLLHVTYYRSLFYKDFKADRYLLRLSPVLHYVFFGAFDNKNPNVLFDNEYYRDNNPGIDWSGQNPLAHYLRHGSHERLNPGPFFESGYYCEQNPEVANSALSPLSHYYQHGKRKGRQTSALIATMNSTQQPKVVDWVTGRAWFENGLGTSAAAAPHAVHCPDRVIRFDWDPGGWNNIRMQVEVLVCLAARYDRALILPEPDDWYLIPGGHSHLFDYFDEAAFRAAVPVLPADTHVHDEWEVPAKLASINTVRLNREAYQCHQGRESWYFPRTTRMFGCFSSVLGSNTQHYSLVNKAFRLRSDLLDKATRLLQDHGLEPGGYLAAHIRRGDFQQTVMRYLSTAEIIEALRRHGADIAGTVLIVSDEYDEELLDACRRQGWETVCWATQSIGDERFAGVLDMLACCLAWRFVGTNLSTFSTGIMQWRGQVSRAAGTSVDAMPRFTNELDQIPWWAAVDEYAWLSI